MWLSVVMMQSLGLGASKVHADLDAQKARLSGWHSDELFVICNCSPCQLDAADQHLAVVSKVASLCHDFWVVSGWKFELDDQIILYLK